MRDRGIILRRIIEGATLEEGIIEGGILEVGIIEGGLIEGAIRERWDKRDSNHREG
jgi:hypothetical protein